MIINFVDLFPSQRKFDIILYPAGEMQVRIKPEYIEEIELSKEIIVNARVTQFDDISHKEISVAYQATNLMGLLLLSDAVHGINPKAKQILNIPYLPYARADRRFTDGDCHGLATFGQFLRMTEFREIRTLDVHNFKAADAFIDNLVNIKPTELIEAAIQEFKPEVLLFPDEGALKRYDTYGLPAYGASKKRNPVTGEFEGFTVPPILNRRIMIIDDICDGGGTFAGIAAAYDGIPWPEYRPPAQFGLYVTHGIFSKETAPLVRFERIYTTNSVRDLTHHSKQIVQYDAFHAMESGTEQEKVFDNRAV